jgi:hypothetical protein
MYCPACSAEAKPEQKFCRACGLKLDGLAERVALHQGSRPVTKSELTGLFIAVGKWMASGGLGLLLLTLMLAFLGAAFDLLSGSTLEFYTMKALAISLVLMVLGGGSLCLPMLLQRKRKPTLPTQSTPVSMPATTVEIAQLQLPTGVGSVTEATTRNLEESRLPADRRQRE